MHRGRSIQTYNRFIQQPAIEQTDTAPATAAPCSGFAPDVYDRYVLGLLDKQERAEIDQHIERRCSICLKGVQRSMNLWMVFAHSLEQMEPAADFRARVVRIAELSNRVLTVPKRHKRVREPALLISSLVVICLILVALLVFTWIAGRQSARLDEERARAELLRLTLELTDKQITIQNQTEQIRRLEEKTSSSGSFTLAQQKRLEDSLSKAQAEIAQYKEIMDRTQQETADNRVLVDAFSNRGLKMFTLKAAEGLNASAYAVVVENLRVVFVAANLPTPPDERQYQVWLVRKDEAALISGGVFSADGDKPVVVTYSEDKESIGKLAGVIVTEEPKNGSSTPTGTRVLQTAGLPEATN